MKSNFPVKVPVLQKVYWIVVDRESPWKAKLLNWTEKGGLVENCYNKDRTIVQLEDMFFEERHADCYLEDLKKIRIKLKEVDMTTAVEFMDGKKLSKNQPKNLLNYKMNLYIEGECTFVVFVDGTMLFASSSCSGPVSYQTPNCDVNPPIFYIGLPE